MIPADPGLPLDCAVGTAMSLIGGKWKPTILCKLIVKGGLRFSELTEEIPAISSKVLTDQLRELVRDGLVHRAETPGPPLRVTYGITDRGRELAPALMALAEWALRNLPMNRVRFNGDIRPG